MKILAIETSTMLGGVAIADDSLGLIAEARLNVKTTHSERLMTVIDQVIAQSGLTIDALDAYAVAAGPGSFTGLRIGLSTAKGLAYAAGKPVVAVPTLEALAWNFPFAGHPVCVLLDARRGEVYAALYRWESGRFIRDIAEISVKAENLLERLDGTVIFAGEGAVAYRDRIIGIMGGRALFGPADKMVPAPSNVAMLGLRMAGEGMGTDPFNAAPLYVRKSEAEVRLQEQKGLSG